MKIDFDVIIVGGGPGGSTAARFCAKAGLKTLLVEKEKLPRYKPCGGCLSIKTVHLLNMDLNPVVETTIYGAKFTYLLRDPFSIHSKEPIAYMVMRDRFDHFLIEKALREGTELLEGVKVIGVEEVDGQIRVELAGGRKVRSQYLIGGDGSGSLVRRTLSLSPPRGDGIAIESEIPFGAGIDYPQSDLQVLHLDFGGVPNGYGWVFPKRAGLSAGIGGMFQEGSRMNPRKYFSDFLKRLKYIDEKRVTKILGHPLPSFYDEKQRVAKGNVLLVGDAAHLMDPLQGEGIYYAIRSGMLATEAVLRSKEKGTSPADLYQSSVEKHISADLKWVLPFSRFVFRFTRLAYRALKNYPDLADVYLRVLEGKDSYEGFVTKVKGRIKDLLGGRLGETIRKAMARA